MEVCSTKALLKSKDQLLLRCHLSIRSYLHNRNLYEARKYLNAIKQIIEETLKLESLNVDISAQLSKILIIANLKLGINFTQSEETPGMKLLSFNFDVI